MSIEILIVDDESLARVRIANYLNKARPEWRVRQAVDGPDALEKIGQLRPDLIFLDVEMPEMDGFSVLMHLGENPPKIIFQTAYNQYAVKAFDANASDYLLKPFTDERLEMALKKTMSAMGGNFSALERQLVNDKHFMNCFAVSAGPRIKILQEDEILYFLSTDHVTRIFLKSNIDYAVETSLIHLEAKLNPEVFLRIHRNCIVRVSEISAIERGNNMSVILKNGVTLPVSRERRKSLIHRFDG